MSAPVELATINAHAWPAEISACSGSSALNTSAWPAALKDDMASPPIVRDCASLDPHKSRSARTDDVVADSCFEFEQDAETCAVRVLLHRHRFAVGDHVRHLPVAE